MKKVKEEEKKITTMEELHEKLIKIGLIETTFEELSTWEQYAVKCDKDPRWKLKFRIYQEGIFFCVIFEKNNEIYSSKSYGGYHPKGFMKIMNMVEWKDDDIDDIEY